MQTIDIITTQNVTIQYALASVRDRILSFVVDEVVLGICTIIFLLVFTTAVSPDASSYFIYLVIIPLVIFYSLAQEILMNGQSIGKRLMSLKVVKITGKEPALSDYLTRWAFRFIDIWFSFGSFAIMLISSTRHQQRLGDLLANTAVIKLNPWATVNLNEILSIHTTDTYKVVYPDVKKYTEEEMLLVKQVLDRFKKFHNNSHREVVSRLAIRMGEQLGLSDVPVNKVEFLRTLLNDYVVLSR